MIKKSLTSILLVAVGTTIVTVCKAQEWKLYLDSAQQAVAARSFSEALVYFDQADKKLPPDSGNTLTAIILLAGTGDAHLRLGNMQTAQKKMEQAMLVAEKNSFAQSPAYATLCERLARTYEQLSPHYAEEFYLKAVDLTKTIYSDSSTEYAAVCNSLANYYYNTARYQNAISLHKQAKLIRGKRLGMRHPDYARSCNNMGAVYLAMGDYELAEKWILEAKHIRSTMQPVKAHPDYAISCINLANLYRDMGQYRKAASLYLEAKNIRSTMQPALLHPQYAASCNILADLYAIQGDTAAAESLYREAMLIREKNNGTNSIAYAESCNNLASLYDGMQQYAKAESLALKAKTIWDSLAPAESPNHAISRNVLGEICFNMNRLEASLAYFKEAGEVWKKQNGDNHPYLVISHYQMARVYNAMNNFAMAAENYRKAMTLQRQQVTGIFRFASEKEKENYLRQSKNIADEYFSFCYSHPQYADAPLLYDHVLSNKGMILSSMRQLRNALYTGNDTVVANNYARWLDAKKQLASLYSRNLFHAEQQEQMQAYTDSLEKWLTRRSAAFNASQRNINWKDVKRKLNKNDVAIEFIDFRYFNGRRWTDSIIYAALVIRTESPVPALVPLCEKKQLDSVLGSVNSFAAIQHLYTRGSNGIKLLRNTKPLYGLVWFPLMPWLNNISHIYFSPSGQLHRVAFAALAIDTAKLLSDRYTLQQCNTTALAGSIGPIVNKEDHLYCFGGINYDAGKSKLQRGLVNEGSSGAGNQAKKHRNQFAYLPGTLEEVKNIKQLADSFAIPATIITGDEATEEKIKSIAEENNPALLHIATHGFFNLPEGSDSYKAFAEINPLLLSGLIFAGVQQGNDSGSQTDRADGILTALEISGLQLHAAKLIVLSACETALGTINGTEGVYGLQRAFRMAGAGSMIMSLWEVPDQESAEFMSCLYRNLFLEKNIAKAFLHTQEYMKNRYRKQPEKWAAWILVQ